MKPLVSKTDFKNYFYIPASYDDDKLGIEIYKTQDSTLRDYLGNDLYESLETSYGKEYAIQSITIGSDTVLTLSSIDGLSVGSYISVFETSGTISSKLNEGRFRIDQISGNDITIDFDSTGLVYTSGSGKLWGSLSEINNNLRNKFIPFLCLATATRLIKNSGQVLTRYAYQDKKNELGNNIDKAQSGYDQSQIDQDKFRYLLRLYEFLKDNTQTYPDWVYKKPRRNKSIGIKSHRPIFKNNIRHVSNYKKDFNE